MAAYITRTTGTAFTSQQKFTASMWVKGNTPPPADSYWWSIGSSGAHITIYAAANGKLNVLGAGPTTFYQYGAVPLRDPTAWYHVVLSVDTTQSDEDDRIKLYINGTLYGEDAHWNSRSYPAEDDAMTGLVSGKIQYIGNNYVDTPWIGLMSHVHYCDGYNYAASDFGEFDATSGIWKIKTSPSVTYGNNGYFLKMEDSSNLDLDSSPNAHTFTTTGTLTPTKDNPSNNFATLNPIDASGLSNTGNTFSNGNLTVTDGSSYYLLTQSTLAVTAGKWYWETFIDATTSSTVSGTGIADLDGFTRADGAANTAYGWIYASDGDKRNNGTSTAYGDTYATNDVIGIALDMDNLAIYFSKNGVWQNSGNPESGASKTNAAYTNLTGTVAAHAYDGASGETHEFSFNFGNGYFGTTSHGETNADDAGIGLFKYDVPAGYYALCTKNIKAYG